MNWKGGYTIVRVVKPTVDRACTTNATDADATTTRNELQPTKYRSQYDSCCPEKDSRGDCKAPSKQDDKDFRPCHVHGAESKHSYDECRNNPKNASAKDKSTNYVKKRGDDAHYVDNQRLSSGEESPSEYETPMANGSKSDDDLSSNDC